MTDLNKLAEALESSAKCVDGGLQDPYAPERMREAAALLRAAAGADVQTFMQMVDEVARTYLNATSPAGVAAYIDARTALESALRLALQERDQAQEVCAEAYQVVGSLLSDLGQFEHPQAEKALDNLSQHRMVHADVLPWPSLPQQTPCTCAACMPQGSPLAGMRMILCPICGNKRCPHATDHRNPCTNSNAPGQPGSSYPPQPKG